jgi:hypothetical protein
VFNLDKGEELFQLQSREKLLITDYRLRGGIAGFIQAIGFAQRVWLLVTLADTLHEFENSLAK